jgi:hypothetical protein
MTKIHKVISYLAPSSNSPLFLSISHELQYHNIIEIIVVLLFSLFQWVKGISNLKYILYESRNLVTNQNDEIINSF